ncbi:hypothetical protein BDV11DRAFT_216408 [Aspergillus similis]
MSLSELKLCDIWCESSAGRDIPDFVFEGGNGGRFDDILAEQYALKCSTLSKRASLRKEGPRLLAQFKATLSVREGERVRYNKFLVTTLRTVEGFIEHSRPWVVADSEERKEVLTRYAAFLNFVEVQGGRRFSLLGLSPNTSSVSSRRRRRTRDVPVRSISGLTSDRHALCQAKYHQYREEVGLDDDGSSSEPEQGSLEAKVDEFIEELGQDGDIRGLEKSSWPFG